VSGSGKSTLVTQVLADLVAVAVGQGPVIEEVEEGEPDPVGDDAAAGVEAAGLEAITRLVIVDQKPIGRTPRSNLATCTGMFDAVRKLFAATEGARRRRWGPGRFSFNVAGGRCETCRGEWFVAVELLFPSGTYGPCPTRGGARYNDETLAIAYRDHSITDVLRLTVDEAADFFADVPAATRSLETLRDVGLGYLRLGQPATELSGGEAQRIKLATELLIAQLHSRSAGSVTRQPHRSLPGPPPVLILSARASLFRSCQVQLSYRPGRGSRRARRPASSASEVRRTSATTISRPTIAPITRPPRPRSADDAWRRRRRGDGDESVSAPAGSDPRRSDTALKEGSR
jgi:hypothetical protein